MVWRDEGVARVGEEEYRAACSRARATAARTGHVGEEGFSSDVPHTISGLVWGSPGDVHDKLRAAFRFYEEMPCYGYLLHVSVYFPGFPTRTRTLLWDRYREFLSGDD